MPEMSNPQSRRRRPRSAAVPPPFAMVSTSATEDRLSVRPPLPWSRRQWPRSAVVARRLRCGLDVGCRDAPRCPAAFAVVSTPAAEDRLFGLPPSPRSLRRRPRCAAVARLPRRGLDAGGRRRPICAAVARLPRRGLDAGGRRPPLWPASLAAVST